MKRYSKKSGGWWMGAILLLALMCLIPAVPARAAESRDAAPQLLKLEAVSYTSQRLTWKAKSGAKGYRVYRKKAGDKSWTNVGVVSTASFLSKELTCGTSYTYTVRAYYIVNGSTVLSGYDKTGLTAQCCPASPVLGGVVNTEPGEQEISCKAVSGAGGYRFYIKGGEYGKSWTKLADTSSTTCRSTGLTMGNSYTYTARAYRKVAGVKIWSGYDSAGITAQAAPAVPVLKKVTPIDNTSQEVSWAPVAGAEGYRIYLREVGVSSWKQVGDTAGCSWQAKGLKCGRNYGYTVRAFVDLEDEEVLGSYDKNGVSDLCRPAAPVLGSLTSTGSGKSLLTWKSVTGAAKYYVYRKTGSGGWSRIGSTTGTLWNDTGLKAGTSYTYTVRAAAVISSSDVLSTYDKSGLRFTAK